MREILEKMLDMKLPCYTRSDIEKAIMSTRMVVDQRTLNNWFQFLWKLEYLTQPEPSVYTLNWTKVAELELPVPLEFDPKQRRLG